MQNWHPVGMDAAGIPPWLNSSHFYLIPVPSCLYLPGKGLRPVWGGGSYRNLWGLLHLHQFSWTSSAPKQSLLSMFSLWPCTDPVLCPQLRFGVPLWAGLGKLLQMCCLGFIHSLLLPSGKFLPRHLCEGTGCLSEPGHVSHTAQGVPCHLLQ